MLSCFLWNPVSCHIAKHLLTFRTFRFYAGDVWDVDISWIEEWLESLDAKSFELVSAAIDALAENGPMLGRPLVDTVRHSKFANMKELRPGSSGRTELRVLFAFDPLRQAIVLVAGDKSGQWNKWYRKNIPVADKRFESHLDGLEGE